MGKAALMEETLTAAADAPHEVRTPLFQRFFAAFPEREKDFLVPHATSIRMTDETLQMMYGLVAETDWVWPLIAELVFTHRAFGPLPIAEYDAYIDMAAEEVVAAAEAARAGSQTTAHRAAWAEGAALLKVKIREARKGWAEGPLGMAIAPGEEFGGV